MMVSANPPGVVFRHRGGRAVFEATDLRAVVDCVGAGLFAAFLECFVGVDRVLTIEQALAFNGRQLKEDRIAYERNVRVLFLLLGGTMYELGEALQELCNAKVIERLANRDCWTPLNELRGKWRGDPRLGRLRNGLSFHLGEASVYAAGLDGALRQSNPPPVYHGDDGLRHGGEYPLAWDTLFRGQELNDSDLTAVVEMTHQGHTTLPDQLTEVFVEVLRTSGVAVSGQDA